ncbi:MAG: hypothetical protein ACQCN4_01835 [Candidatus Bathyarchaeia archaeon]
MKRTIVWIDSPDNSAYQVREYLKEFLSKSGVKATIFEACEIMESENE